VYNKSSQAEHYLCTAKIAIKYLRYAENKQRFTDAKSINVANIIATNILKVEIHDH